MKTEAQRLDPLARPDGIVTKPSDLQCSASLLILVKSIADTLERHYPGWAWAVQPDERGGVINLRAMKLHGQWGWRMKISSVQNDPHLKEALRGGGEILERFGQKRGPYDYQRWQAQKSKYGLKDFDITDKAAKVRRRRNDDDFTAAVRSGALKLKVVDTPTQQGTHRQLYVQPSALWER